MLPESFTPQFLRQLELMRIRSRRAFLGSRQGGHLSLKRGHGLEFSDYRKYELGDHPRSIDWGVYARSERLYVKRFQEEQDLSVMIILDASASMDTPAQDGKWIRAKEMSMALAYVALMQQDSVNLAVLGAKRSPTYYGAKAIHHIAKSLEQLAVQGPLEVSKEVRRAASGIRFPGVAIFVSDFLMPFEEIRQSFNILRSKNLDLTAVQILGPSDIYPLRGLDAVVAVDSESGEEINLSLDETARQEYEAAFAQHIARLKDFFADNRVAYVSAPSAQSISTLFINNMSQAGLLI